MPDSRHAWCDNLGEGWCSECGAHSPSYPELGDEPYDPDYCPGAPAPAAPERIMLTAEELAVFMRRLGMPPQFNASLAEHFGVTAEQWLARVEGKLTGGE